MIRTATFRRGSVFGGRASIRLGTRTASSGRPTPSGGHSELGTRLLKRNHAASLRTKNSTYETGNRHTVTSVVPHVHVTHAVSSSKGTRMSGRSRTAAR